jgi:hypothetical protein
MTTDQQPPPTQSPTYSDAFDKYIRNALASKLPANNDKSGNGPTTSKCIFPGFEVPCMTVLNSSHQPDIDNPGGIQNVLFEHCRATDAASASFRNEVQQDFLTHWDDLRYLKTDLKELAALSCSTAQQMDKNARHLAALKLTVNAILSGLQDITLAPAVGMMSLTSNEGSVQLPTLSQQQHCLVHSNPALAKLRWVRPDFVPSQHHVRSTMMTIILTHRRPPTRQTTSSSR